MSDRWEKAECCMRRARRLLDAGNTPGAREFLGQAILLVPCFPEAHALLGQCLLQEEKWTEAAETLRKAAELSPDDAGTHFLLGLALLRVWRPDAAEQALRESIALRLAIRHNTGFPEAHWNLADVLFVRGRHEEAVREVRTALRLQPDWADAHRLLGRIRLGMKDFSAAETAFREAIRMAPRDAEALCDLGMMLADLGRCAEAVSLLEDASRWMPDLTEARRKIGEISQHLKTDEFSRHARLGEDFYHRYRLPEAVRNLEQAKVLRPEAAAPRRLLALALGHLHQEDACVRELSEIAAQTGDPFDRAMHLGAVCAYGGDDRGAILHYAEACRLAPGFAPAHLRLGVCRMQGDPDPLRALASFLTGLRMRPDSVCLLRNTAWCLCGIGRAADALGYANRLLEAGHPDYLTMHLLAMVRMYRGELEESDRWWKHVLECPEASEANSYRSAQVRGLIEGKLHVLEASVGQATYLIRSSERVGIRVEDDSRFDIQVR